AKAAHLQTLLPQNFEIIFDYIDLNFIVSTINGTSRALFDTYDTPEQVKGAINFGQHLLALKKAQEDAYPEEVKALNRVLAQSNLAAPNMHLRIYYNDFHIGSFCGVELCKLHVKSFVTDKIHFNVCYACEPLECYDTFEEVTAAIDHFKDAIKRGATEFTFPTIDELNTPSDKQLIDSLIRAMETCLLNIQAICLTKPTNLSAINREWELYQICNNALLRKEVA
ncbi:MAG: hypothetical protein IJP68_04420, partial [Selenomonadaceae bacterium]|nr:hypothetical protein [Selenomonadaceae bacterium]